MDNHRSYWELHWKSHRKLDDSDPQKQVARTRFGKSISEDDWLKTCQHVFAQVRPKPTDTILDLCCGNGLLSAYMLEYVDKIIAVDFSKKLIENFIVNDARVTKVLCDAVEFDYASYSFDHALMYFAAQHFDEASLVSVITKVCRCLKKGGCFLIGDIPDIRRKWNFYLNRDFRFQYFSNLLRGREAIGTWYEKIFFKYLSEYVGFGSVEILDQPKFMINSYYRFDVIFKK